jgi:uncharacterized membrane-anchored protein
LDAAVEGTFELMSLEAGLDRRSGDVVVGADLATMKLGEKWTFIDGPSTSKVIEIWGNPRPAEDPLGLVSLAEHPVIDGGWAVIAQYTEEGHVDDADAADIDFDAMLEEMKEDARLGSEERVKLGLDPLELVGWAEPPHYDPATKKLYWAKLLRSPSGESLNYNVRILGRKGVLELTAVAPPEMLPEIKPAMEDLIGAVEFNAGSRYSDFDPDVDAMAAYGIGALIAGKMAAKAGFFKLAIAALFASKKLIAGGAIALFAGIRAMFGGKKEG